MSASNSGSARAQPSRAAALVDRLCSGMVFLGACGHTAGSLMSYPAHSDVLVYALGVSVLGWACAYLNYLRSCRPMDRAVAAAALLTSLGQAGVAVAWGFAIGDPLDPRAVGFAAFAGALVLFSVAGVVRGR